MKNGMRNEFAAARNSKVQAMSLTITFKLIHVLVAFWFVGGILGRTFTQQAAARAADVKSVQLLMRLNEFFEKRIVIPGSLLVLLAGIVTAVLGSWSMFGFLEGARTNWLLVALALFLSNIPLIPFVYNPRGKNFDRALENAAAKSEITPELRAAFHDPVVATAHGYEIITIVIIIALMVMKPI